jgi:hypothetical protein
MRTWIVACLAAALAAPGAAAAREASVEAGTGQLRDRGGVCVSDLQGVTLATFVQPIVCIGIGTPFTISDSHEPWLYVEIQTDAKHQADVKEWKLTVLGPDGKAVVDGRQLDLEKSRLPANECAAAGGCRQTAVTMKMPAWKPGRYRFHLVFLPDPEITSDLAVELK